MAELEKTLVRLRKLTATSWFWWVVIGLPVAALVTYVLYRFDEDGKRLAAMESALEKAKEAQRDAVARARIAQAEIERLRHEKEARRLATEIKIVEAQVSEEKKAHEAREAAIKRLRGAALDDAWENGPGAERPGPGA